MHRGAPGEVGPEAELAAGAADHLVARPAGERLERSVHIAEAAGLQVAHHHRHRRPGEHRREALVRLAQVAQRALLVRAVVAGDDDPADRAGLVGPGLHHPAQPVFVAGGVAPGVVLVAHRLAGQRAPVCRLPVLGLVGQQPVVVQAAQVGMALAEVLDPQLAGGQVVHVPVEHRDAQRRLLHEAGELRARTAQGLLGLAACRHVAVHAEQGDRCAVGGDDAQCGRLAPEQPAVAAAVAQFVVLLAGRCVGHEAPAGGGEIGRVGVQELGGAAEHLLGGVAEQPREGRVDEGDAALQVGRHQRLGQLLEQRAQRGLAALQGQAGLLARQRSMVERGARCIDLGDAGPRGPGSGLGQGRHRACDAARAQAPGDLPGQRRGGDRGQQRRAGLGERPELAALVDVDHQLPGGMGQRHGDAVGVVRRGLGRGAPSEGAGDRPSGAVQQRHRPPDRAARRDQGGLEPGRLDRGEQRALGTTGAQHRHRECDQRALDDRAGEQVAHRRPAGVQRERHRRPPGRPRQRRQRGAEGHAGVQQHAAAVVADQHLAAEVLPEHLRAAVEVAQALFVEQRRGRQQRERRAAVGQHVVHPAGDLPGQLLRALRVVAALVPHARAGQQHREQQQWQVRQPDQAPQETRKRRRAGGGRTVWHGHGE
nr:hypothetical protein [Piscinibacter sp.]